MEKQPDIVPIQLDNQNDFDPMTHVHLQQYKLAHF